jgi:hypothetical protein
VRHIFALYDLKCGLRSVECLSKRNMPSNRPRDKYAQPGDENGGPHDVICAPMHAATGDGNAAHYRVHIKNVKLFKFVVGQVALGCSFRLASRQIALVLEELSLVHLNGCNESSVSRFVQVAAAACLQKISELLKRTWAFSVAFDSSTIKVTSYFDVRVRFAADAQLHCFHMLALPLHGSHTGQLLFDVFEQAMDAIIPG